MALAAAAGASGPFDKLRVTKAWCVMLSLSKHDTIEAPQPFAIPRLGFSGKEEKRGAASLRRPVRFDGLAA
ncbi:MAG TPA: hypothetical protein VGI19_10635 [Candidatus Cybelea sp.]|jgi:hypothetical protein